MICACGGGAGEDGGLGGMLSPREAGRQAEVGEMWPQAKECQWSPETGRDKE